MASRSPTRNRSTAFSSSPPRSLRPVERALMLMALGLDPRLTYTDYELQCAWRRRKRDVHTDNGHDKVIDAAVNAAYVTLIGQAGTPRPVDVRL